jgi:hypothetical protein
MTSGELRLFLLAYAMFHILTQLKICLFIRRIIMAYGQPQPFGLVPWKQSIAGIYNGQTMQFPIKSGYANNIFRGDLVYVGPDGFLHNLFDLGNGTYPTATAWGVFNGCSYVQPTATNPIDPASPGRPYWPGGTNTANGVNATADVIVDPNIIYTIQVDATGIAWTAQGANFSVVYDGTGAPTPNGNTITGQSTMQLNSATIGADHTKNLLVIGFDNYPGNPIPVAGGGPQPYVNALVVISNHQFKQIPNGHA